MTCLCNAEHETYIRKDAVSHCRPTRTTSLWTWSTPLQELWEYRHRNVHFVLASLNQTWERGSPHLCLCRPHDWNDDALQGQDWFGPRIILRCVELGEESIFTARALEQANIKVVKNAHWACHKFNRFILSIYYSDTNMSIKGPKLICSDYNSRKLIKNGHGNLLLMKDFEREIKAVRETSQLWLSGHAVQ